MKITEVQKIIRALGKVSGPVVKGDCGTGTSCGVKYPEGTTAETIKTDLYWILIDLSTDLGIREKIDCEQLSAEVFGHPHSGSIDRWNTKPTKPVKARIHYLYGEWEGYEVSSRRECRDNTDRSAYDALLSSGERSISMGKVVVERL